MTNSTKITSTRQPMFGRKRGVHRGLQTTEGFCSGRWTFGALFGATPELAGPERLAVFRSWSPAAQRAAFDDLRRRIGRKRAEADR
jgi:hypothetical protein